MGTTPTYGLSYPDGTDLVIQGDDAIEELATDVEAALTAIEDGLEAPLRATSFIYSDLGASPAQAAVTGGVLATHGGVTAGPDWAFNGTDSFTYSGPLRWFMVTASMKIAVSGAGGATNTSRAALQVNGADVKRTEHTTSVVTADGASVFGTHTHTLDTVLLLATGSLLTMAAFGDSNITDKVIRVVSLGGAQ